MQDSMTTEALRILAFAALTLSVRVLTWLSLIGGMSLFGYAIYEPNRERTIAAALFAVLMFIPSLWSEKKERRQPPPVQRYQDQEAA
jgi:uncharacterized membrane protein YqjE